MADVDASMIRILGTDIGPRVALGAFLWVPGMLVGSGVVRGFDLTPDLVMAVNLMVSSLMGVPLALACRLIHSDGRQVTAWCIFGVLAPVTFVGVLFAGLLGFLFMGMVAVVVSLPAWVVFLVMRWLDRRRRSA